MHKPDVPLRMIVDFRNLPTFNLARYLSRNISLAMGKTLRNHITISVHFQQKLRPVQAKFTETMASFDVSSLFTNAQIAKTTDILMNLLIKDHSQHNRTILDATEIAVGLFCTKCGSSACPKLYSRREVLGALYRSPYFGYKDSNLDPTQMRWHLEHKARSEVYIARQEGCTEIWPTTPTVQYFYVSS